MNDQSQMMNQHQMAHMVNQQPPPPQLVNQMVSQGGQMMASQSYGQWPPQPPHSMAPPPVVMNAMKFPMSNPPMYAAGVSKPGRGGGTGSGNNWKGKKPMDKRKDLRRKDKNNLNNMNMNMNMSMNMNLNAINNSNLKGFNGGGGYQPPTLYELEQQNRLKARRFYHPKRKFNRMGPYAHAPRNTTSYIIRAKKSGGIASLVSPCPVTPAVLPTPVFSPSREALVDMAKEEWGVDGYGSMKGLIRLRSPGHDEAEDDYDEDEDGGSSESDVEEHVEVERRLDHDLSRFEMIYPNSGADYHNVLENRVDDQDTHIAQLEEENLILKERLYLMEREVGELRRRLLCLERQHQVVEDINEEVVENVSENDSEGLKSDHLLVHKDNEEVNYVPRHGARGRRENSDESLHKELKELAVKDVFHCGAMEGNDYGTGSEVNRRENGLADDGMGFKGHDDKLIGDVNVKPSDQDQTLDHKDLSSADGILAGRIHEVVRYEPVGDACTGVALLDDVNENDRSEKGADSVTGVILKKESETAASKAQAEGCNNTNGNEEVGDVCMGDSGI